MAKDISKYDPAYGEDLEQVQIGGNNQEMPIAINLVSHHTSSSDGPRDADAHAQPGDPNVKRATITST